MTIRIKPIEDVHLKAVKAIEKLCFQIPWNDKIFHMLAKWKGLLLLEKGKIIRMDVLEEDEETAGYIVWEENRVRLMGRIMNVAVKQSSRKKGFGELLLTHAFRSLKKNGIEICSLEVRESNSSARLLYERAGMKVSGRVPEYYETEDAIIYSIDL